MPYDLFYQNPILFSFVCYQKARKLCMSNLYIFTLTVSNLLSFSIPCQYQGLHDKIKKIKSKGGKDKAESYGSGMVGIPSNLQTRLDSPPASFVVSISSCT